MFSQRCELLKWSPELTFPILCNAYLCHQLQRKCSIGNLVFSYGVVSPCKNLQTSVSVTRLIMGKDDRCQSTMDLTSSITSQYHHQLRKLPSPPMKILHFTLYISQWQWSKWNSNCFSLFKFVSTQIPQAVGAAYSLKMDQKNACAVTYFGDGGTSEVNEWMEGNRMHMDVLQITVGL